MRMNSNYAIKPTPEQALGTNRTQPPARLIAALDLIGGSMETQADIEQIEGYIRNWEKLLNGAREALEAIEFLLRNGAVPHENREHFEQKYLHYSSGVGIYERCLARAQEQLRQAKGG